MDDHAATRRRVDASLERRRPGARDGLPAALEHLCHVARTDLTLLGAAVTLLPSVGAHVVAAASPDVARRLEQLQFDVAEGPSTDAFATRRPVLVSDLARTGQSRWPWWAQAAVREGARSAYAFPLHVGAAGFGVLSLYGDRSPGLDETGVATALVFAEVATERLLDDSLVGDGQQLAPGLGGTLDLHAHVYQAQGMVMVELGIGLGEALALMRAHAWASGTDLRTLASEIVAGRSMPAKDTT